MIILRTMGTIQLEQAALPAMDFHDANYTPFEIFGARPIGRGKRSHASCVTPAPRCSHSTGTPLCGTHLARRWRSRVHRVAPRRDIGYITAPFLSRGNTASGKMGHPKAPGINGQPRTPHTDSNSHRNRKSLNALTSRQITCDGPRSNGTYIAVRSVSTKGGLQQLKQGWVSLSLGCRP